MELQSGTAISSSYAICTNPRSGSWLLSEGLAATGLAGRPREWFFPGTTPGGTDFEAHFGQVLQKGTTDNGIFGVKLHFNQFAHLQRKLHGHPEFRGLKAPQRMAAAFSGLRYVFLARRDKERQAISYYRARHSGRWWQIEGREVDERGRVEQEIPFNPHAIREFERLLALNDSRWRRYFKVAGIEPLVLHYEDLAADYEGCLRKILEWLGVTGHASVRIAPSHLKRQADVLSEDWLARYLDFKKNPWSAAVPTGARPSNVRGHQGLEGKAIPLGVRRPVDGSYRAFFPAKLTMDAPEGPRVPDLGLSPATLAAVERCEAALRSAAPKADAEIDLFSSLRGSKGNDPKRLASAYAAGFAALAAGSAPLDALLEAETALLGRPQAKDGRCRLHQNWVHGRSVHDARFVPPPPAAVPEALEDLGRFMALADVPPLAAAAIAFGELQLMHPFSDGNGRMGRLLVPLLLASKGLDRRPWAALEVRIQASRSRYARETARLEFALGWDRWVTYICDELQRAYRPDGAET